MKFKSKQEVREYVWNKMKELKICSFPCYGHIPNFIGSEKTIEKIVELEEYKSAKRIFVSPDTPQRSLIKYALNDGKEVYMASPRLLKGFCKVKSFGNLKEIVSKSEIIGFKIPKIDFALIGSVAVDLKGNRIGKGAGYGDREIEILRKNSENVVVATNVHEIQIFEDLEYLMELFDQKVNLIVSLERIIKL